MSTDNQMAVIEITADYLCFVVLGDKKTIDNIVDDMPSDNIVKYISVKIDCPSAKKCHEIALELNNGKDIIIDDGVETAQCYTYAEGYDNQLYMLMCITEHNDYYTLSYPKFELGDEEDPEILIEDWFRKQIGRIPHGLKKNMKLITVVGTDTNILVVATRINKKKHKK